MSTEDLRDQFHYEGFSSPNGTIVPDDVFDVLLPRLTDPELRVLLYIIRRTFGFKRDSDTISLRQMVDGIRTRDGRILDGGTGMSKASVARGLKGLAAKGVILVTHNSSRERGDEPTSYALRFRTGPVSQIETRGVSQNKTRGVSQLETGRVSPVDPQQTGRQQTDFDHSNIRKAQTKDFSSASEIPMRSNEVHEPAENGLKPVETILKSRRGRPPKAAYADPDRQVILDYITDFAREFADQAPLASSTTRAYNLYKAAGIDLDTLIGAMQQARSIVKERSGSIRTQTDDPNRPFTVKAKMGYWFSVLEDVLGLRGAPPTAKP